METVIAVVVAIAVTAIVVYFVTSAYHKKVTEAKIGNAEEKAREIIDEAVKTAETKKREAMLSQLTPVQRRRFELFEDGMTVAEIARKEKAAFNSVKESIESAQKKLKKLL